MTVHYDGLVGSVYPTKEEEVYLANRINQFFSGFLR